VWVFVASLLLGYHSAGGDADDASSLSTSTSTCGMHASAELYRVHLLDSCEIDDGVHPFLVVWPLYTQGIGRGTHAQPAQNYLNGCIIHSVIYPLE